MTHPYLIEVMKKPDFYPHRPDKVELIQTHISYVFLAGDFVYKIKKPLKFDFLDFSTLEKRKFFCEEELTLNRRLAPDTYLDVVAIFQNMDDDITLNPGGEIIEYAVLMKRLPDDRMLKALLAQGMTNEAIMDKLAQKIALFHQTAQTGTHIDEMGSVENIRRNTKDNLNETRPYIQVTLPEYQYLFIKEYMDGFLTKNQQLFERRILDHKIRDCHGDLHLDHICINDNMTIFDCIEFNNRFRFGDVAEDVAFLTMDIDYNGYPRHAEYLVESYIRHSGDRDILKLLNFYRCYYACVRGKVTSLRLSQKEFTANERLEIKQSAEKYFNLAYSYAARLTNPVLIMMAGLMGSGKSYQARVLAAQLGADVIVTDILRKELFHIQPTERRHEAFGQGIYSDDISRQVYDKALELALQTIHRGKSVILDASFKKREERRKALDVARNHGIVSYVLECSCPDHITKARLEKRERNNDNTSDGRWELFQKQQNDFDTITEVPDHQYFRIDTSVNPEMARHEFIKKIKWNDDLM